MLKRGSGQISQNMEEGMLKLHFDSSVGILHKDRMDERMKCTLQGEMAMSKSLCLWKTTTENVTGTKLI